MAVRFLPSPEERPASSRRPDRTDLAEVVELRSRLGSQGWAPAVPAAGARPIGALPIDARSDDEPSADQGPAESALETEAAVEAAPTIEAVWAVDTESAVETESARDRAYADGVKLLARKARSSGELREELLRFEHDAHEVEAIVAEFEESLYLDDLGLARAVTEKLRDAKRASRTQIRMKLRDRRLPDSVIESALGELDTDEEYDLLREAAEDRARKLSGLDRQTAERRLLGFLARRGWSGEPAMRAARDALSGSAAGGSGVRFR